MERLPAWVGEDGYPRSWGHYVYGMAYLARSRTRWLLDVAEAVRAGGSTEDAYSVFKRDRRKHAYRH